MKLKRLGMVICLLCVHCAAPLKEFYPDTYFSEDNIYHNKAIGFTLEFAGQWDITIHPSEMSRSTRAFARQVQKYNGELLFTGTTVENTHAVRAIAININAPLDAYAESIQKANAGDVTEDFGTQSILIKDIPMIRWHYQSGTFMFTEYFVKIKTYNVRIAFWSIPSLHSRFQEMYLATIATLTRSGLH